ncbi:MAG TPA: hypothetical protein VHB73_06530, partial [Alphaproteobacteria bacterium]|nr:hypothetical protein [Alphaproteobacteria bacterium]
DSGTVITDKQLDTLFCQLGAIGKMRNGCQVEADPRVEGCDISFARCNGSHGRNIAIPFDPDSFVNDLKKALDELKKKDPSINVADGNKQIIAVLASLRKSLGRQCTWPGGRQMDTIKSVSEAARMGDVLESRYAPNEAVLHAIEVHLAYSNRFLPKCDDNDVGLMSYLKKAYPNAAPGNAYYPYLPPSGYCLSGWQVDLAKISRDRLALQEPPPPGTPAEQENWRTNLEHSIKARETAHRELMQLASDAAGGRTSASVCVETSRPISTSSLDGQDVQDLMGSIRSLTRAIQDLQQKRPHVLEVRAPASSPEPEYRPASAAALPPLRQDFPAVP